MVWGTAAQDADDFFAVPDGELAREVGEGLSVGCGCEGDWEGGGREDAVDD